MTAAQALQFAQALVGIGQRLQHDGGIFHQGGACLRQHDAAADPLEQGEAAQPLYLLIWNETAAGVRPRRSATRAKDRVSAASTKT